MGRSTSLIASAGTRNTVAKCAARLEGYGLISVTRKARSKDVYEVIHNPAFNRINPEAVLPKVERRYRREGYKGPTTGAELAKHASRVTFRTRGEANAALSTIHDKLRGGTWIDPQGSRTVFLEWAEQWKGTTLDLRASTRIRDFGYLDRYVIAEFWR